MVGSSQAATAESYEYVASLKTSSLDVKVLELPLRSIELREISHLGRLLSVLTE